MSFNRCTVIRLFAAAAATSLLPFTAFAQLPVAPAARLSTRDYPSELACGARASATRPDETLRIAPGRERGKFLLGPSDPIIVRGGTAEGVRVGQDYFVRRVTADRFTEAGSDGVPTLSIHTSGWIRIVQVQDHAAIATVTRACGGMQEGDYLEAFAMPEIPTAATRTGDADFAHPGRIVLGDDRRQMGASGDLMVFDRGSDHGLRKGQHLTIFRETTDGLGVIIRIGEGTAMLVSPETTIVRIDRSSDAVYVGDMVAIHR
jgi:hypothetical protein